MQKTRHLNTFMKKRILVGSLVAWFSALLLAAAPLGTTFTYQGRLNDNGAPATGLYDLRFTLYDALASGNAVAEPLTNVATGVTNGLFTVRLDFGTNVFTGDARWLEMAARANGSAVPFETMIPRNELTPAPFAFFASTAANLSGTVPLAQLPASLVTNGQTGLTLGGTFTGNGTGLSNLSASAIVGWALGNAWTLGGNNVAPGQFLGSTNDQPLELWVSGRRALRLEPVDGGFPNVLGGDSINTIAGGVGSATIAGGADQHIGASADGTFLGGGYLNTVNEGAVFATIAGGTYNLIDAYATHSTIGGGELNTIEAGANHSLIAGGFQNSVSNGTMFGVIAGGQANTNGGSRSVIGGGLRNFIQMSCEDGASTLGGGSYNQILGFSDYATITGGNGNTIGSGLLEGFTTAATIGGGTQNRISEGAEVSLIAGGINNSVSTNARSAVIGGGGNNVIAASATNAVIAGGQGNIVAAGAFDSIIAGGANNQISGLSQSRLFSPKIVLPPATPPTLAASRSVVGGGFGNVNGSPASVIAGGWQNRIGVNANNATVAGGANNQIVSSAWNSAIGGGENNTIAAGATNAVIPGGSGNSVAAKGGFAAGRDAHVQAGHDGSFVWGDGTGGAYTTGSNRFEALATGGANFYTGTSSLTGIEGVGTPTAPGASAIYGVAFDYDGNGVVGQADSGREAAGILGWAANGSGGFFAGRNGVVANGTEVGLSASAPSGGYAAVFDGDVQANGAVAASSLAVNGSVTASSLGVSGTVTAGSFVGNGGGLTNLNGASIANSTITSSQLAHGAAAANLAASGQSGLPSGAMILSSNVADAKLIAVGYVKLGKVELGDYWEMRSTNAPSARVLHTAVWTGTEMIVWGGTLDEVSLEVAMNSGGRYNPATDSWTPLPIWGAPVNRVCHTAVWTGSEMIIWGGQNSILGYLNDGGRYNPTTDSWTAMTTSGAPVGRFFHTAVWTGSEMIIWGGGQADFWFDEEADPTWEYLRNDGGRYNPVLDSWVPMALDNAPAPRFRHTAVWTGNQMIVWGGTGSDGYHLKDGGRYDLPSDSWMAVTTSGAPTPRDRHTAIWTGSEMIIWGGWQGSNSMSTAQVGGRYDPVTDGWSKVNEEGAPIARMDRSAVWTGSEMIIWGGWGVVGAALQSEWPSYSDGSCFNPTLNHWTAIPNSNTASKRYKHTAVWTGTEMIIWGGETGEYGMLVSNDTPSYTPARKLYLYQRP